LQSWRGVAPLKRWVLKKVPLVAVVGGTYIIVIMMMIVMVMMIMIVMVMIIPCKRTSDLLHLYL